MVHKKYTYKNGKKYGPYLYETKRVDGRIVTRYIGPSNNSDSTKIFSKKFVFPSIFFLTFAVLLLFFALYPNITGNVTLDVKGKYDYGEKVTGNLILGIKAGELIPKDSVVIVSFGDYEKDIALSDLIDEDTIEGDFYAEGSSISGSGEGFGHIGTKKIYPEVEFELEIFKDSESSEGGSSNQDDVLNVSEDEASDESSSEDDVDEVQEEQGNQQDESQGVGQITQEPVPDQGSSGSQSGSNGGSGESESGEPGGSSGEGSSTSGEGGESGGESGGGITGAAVSDFTSTIKGKASKEGDFEYEINEDENARIITGSVKINGEQQNDNIIKLSVNGNKIKVSTDHYIEEEGFGEEFIGGRKLTLEVPLDGFNVEVLQDGELDVRLLYGEYGIVEVSKSISVKEKEIFAGNDSQNDSEIIINNTKNDSIIKDVNGSIGINDTYFNNSINDSNKTIPEIVIVNETNVSRINVSVAVEGRIIIGKPVKWIKKVDAKGPASISVEIPESAENVSFRKIKDDYYNESDFELNDRDSDSEHEEIIEREDNETDNSNENNETEVFEVDITGNVITGKVTAELNLDNDRENIILSWLKRAFGSITGYAVSEMKGNEVEIELDASDKGVEVEYYTPSPYLIEENLDNGKRVVVVGPDDVHYENVISFVELDESLDARPDNLKIYWEENGSYIIPDSVDDMSFEQVFLEPSQDRYFRKFLDATGYRPGNYLAEAIVLYGGDMVRINETFRIGSLFVNITNFTDELPKKGIQKFYVGIESRWNGALDEVFADVNLSNGIQNITFRTPSINLGAWESKNLEGYINTDELEGIYEADITLKYAGQTTSARGNLEIKEFSYMVFAITGIIFIFGIIGIIYYIRKKRNEK